MAGDWIKVEKCSPGKPEVMRLARLWGVHQDQALGAVLRFWIWLDDACVDGVVDGVASHEIDAQMHFPGFAQGLVSVGWLEIDDKKPCTRIPNFERHNAESAKKRALKSDRQAKWRGKFVDAAPSTKASLEKRREEKIDNSLRSLSTATKKRTPLVEPTPEHEAIAAERGLSCQTEFQKYRDWQASTGKSHKDEVAGFRNWLRNAKVVVGSSDSRRERHARNMDILTGKVRDERTVEGIAERIDRPPLLAIAGGVREPDGLDVEGCRPPRGAAGVG